MIINTIKTHRFTFNNWVKDARNYWNSLSKITIANKYPTLVLITVEERDSDKVNQNIKELTEIILENIELVDEEGDDFRPEMFLESSGGNSIPFTLMFFQDK